MSIMEFTIQDTFSTYRKIIAEKDIEKKYEIFMGELIGPFEGMFKAFGAPMKSASGGPDALAMCRSWAFLMPEMLDERALADIRKFEEAGAPGLCEKTMKDVIAMFGVRADKRSKRIRVGIFLQDGSKMDPKDMGYTGFGGIPGYITLNYAKVTDYNLSRLQSTLAHEAHHNIAGTAGWDPANVSVGSYIIVEGLAESFAAALYGKDKIGPWVADFPMYDMPRIKAIYKSALSIKGFDAVRPYIFGDEKSGTKLGLPNTAGYAVGYHVVQAFMKKTGKDIVEATFTPAERIIEESGFFD